MIAQVPAGDWDPLLERLGFADAYYLHAYLETACLLDEGRPVLLHDGDSVFPFVLRDVPGTDLRDVTTPYGYGGPLGEPGFYDAYDEWCRANGVVTTFLRFHPVFANQRLAPPRTHLEELGTTIEWTFEPDDDLMAGMHPKHRNKVRKARKAGLETSVEEAPGDLSEFVALYDATMARLAAGDFYFFPAEYWRRLEGDRHIVRVDARFGDELAASGLFLSSRPWLHYHVSGTTERGRDAAAANLVVFEAGCWGQANGFRSFHLGGGLRSGRDSLYDFKVRFAPDGEREAYEAKLVHDPDAYRQLGGDPDDLSGFFPAYRRGRT